MFSTVQFALTSIAAVYLAVADGHTASGLALQKAGGVFAFLAGSLEYYTVGNLICQDTLSFRIPMGDISKHFGEARENTRENSK